MLPIILFALIIVNFQNANGQMSMGPLNVNLIHSERCDGDKDYIDIQIVGLDNDQKGLNYKVDIPFDFDDTVSYEIKIDKIQNGQVQPGIFKTKGPHACQDYDKFLGKMWTKLRSAANMPTECPLTAGNYAAQNFPFENDDIALEKFLYGHFIMTVTMAQDNNLFLCHRIEFTNNRKGDSI